MRGPEPIPSAPAAVAELLRRGIPTALFTNDSVHAPAEWVAILRAAGFPALRPEQILTAGLAAVIWVARHQPDGRVRVVGSDSLRSLARDHGLRPVAAGAAGAVLIGEGEPFDQALLLELAERVRAGARLVVACLDPQIPGPAGPVFCPGSVLGHAVAYAAQRRPVVGGKPSAWAARLALARLGTLPPETAMVGDQVEDMRLAYAGGLRGVLALSGLTADGDWRRWPARWHPAAVVPDVGAVPALVAAGAAPGHVRLPSSPPPGRHRAAEGGAGG